LAHPLDNGQAAWLERDVDRTAHSLGQDAVAYRRTMLPLVRGWQRLVPDILQPIPHIPAHPWLLFKFGKLGLQSAQGLSRRTFKTEAARSLFGGLAAHSFLPLQQAGSAAVGLVLGLLAHAVGWPMPKGGAGSLTRAMVGLFESLGGRIERNHRVTTLDELPAARAILFDVSPRQLLSIAGHRFPRGYQKALVRFRFGPGIFKVDYALHSPIPWSAPPCRQAGTVHVGGALEEIARGEWQVANGTHPGRPFVLLAQHSIFDSSRAPAARHTAWAYCHVPNGSTVDMTERIEAQIERFAPGFRQCILQKSARTTRVLEDENANLVGGDINGGFGSLWQMLARPVLRPAPYKTPLPGVFICSASTPPGGGVHGMCGHNAARHALKWLLDQ
jgi:phytoene dehydrogenase-like protein